MIFFILNRAPRDYGGLAPSVSWMTGAPQFDGHASVDFQKQAVVLFSVVHILKERGSKHSSWRAVGILALTELPKSQEAEWVYTLVEHRGFFLFFFRNRDRKGSLSAQLLSKRQLEVWRSLHLQVSVSTSLSSQQGLSALMLFAWGDEEFFVGLGRGLSYAWWCVDQRPWLLPTGGS